MRLNVAVQMDPIERINIRGDSTFALLLEAQTRAHPLSYYTPDQLELRDGKVSATVRPLAVRDVAGDHFTLGEPRHADLASFDVVLLRQDPPFDLAYISSTHMLERIHPKTLVVNDPAHVRNAPEKIFVTEFPDLMPPTLITRDLDAIKAIPRRARRHRHEAALRQRRRGGVSAGGARISISARCTICSPRHVPRAMGGAEIPARGEGRATSASSWSTASSPARSTACRRRTICAPTWCAAAWPRRPISPSASAKSARGSGRRCASAACFRRHRRDRRFPHRDQRHLADRHPLGEKSRRPRYRGADLGQDRGEAELAVQPSLSIFSHSCGAGQV